MPWAKRYFALDVRGKGEKNICGLEKKLDSASHRSVKGSRTWARAVLQFCLAVILYQALICCFDGKLQSAANFKSVIIKMCIKIDISLTVYS